MIKIILILAAATALLAGCRAETQGGRERVDIRGRVTQVFPASGDMGLPNRPKGVVQVDGMLQPDTHYDRAAVTVTDSTRIRIASGEEYRDGVFADIRTGDSVEATFTGPVRESYPVQVAAGQITIVSRR